MFEFIHGDILIAAHAGPPVSVPVIVNMTRPVRAGTQPVVLLTGFRYGFTRSGGDRRLGQVNIMLGIEGTPTGTAVTVGVLLGVRDWSGEFDDSYEGMVSFVVVADLE